MNTTMLHRLLYQFKRHWGVELDYMQIEFAETNLSTGSRTWIRTLFPIDAIPMPEDRLRKFIQDIGYLAANKNFTYGGFNDYNSIKFMIDVDDAPPNFKPDLTGYILYKGKRYERVAFENFADTIFILTCKGVEGAFNYNVIDIHVEQRLRMQGEITNG